MTAAHGAFLPNWERPTIYNLRAWARHPGAPTASVVKVHGPHCGVEGRGTKACARLPTVSRNTQSSTSQWPMSDWAEPHGLRARQAGKTEAAAQRRRRPGFPRGSSFLSSMVRTNFLATSHGRPRPLVSHQQLPASEYNGCSHRKRSRLTRCLAQGRSRPPDSWPP